MFLASSFCQGLLNFVIRAANDVSVPCNRHLQQASVGVGRAARRSPTLTVPGGSMVYDNTRRIPSPLDTQSWAISSTSSICPPCVVRVASSILAFQMVIFDFFQKV